MNHTLDDLAEEYLHTADLLSQMIEHGNALLRRARAEGNQLRCYALRSRQQDLYAQRAHVLEIAVHLKTYYNTAPANIQ